MSFGYSIGDAFALASVIERIVNEVQAYRSAPLHFQRLTVELGFLSSVCKQVFELRPSPSDELQHIERIRAIAIQCLDPIREFEAKMAKYENTLGTHKVQHGTTGNKKRKRERVKSFGNRLHWSAIARHDVDELRAIVTSEILAINTLLTMVEWDSLKSQNFVSQTYLTQIRTLMSTTQEASMETRQYLIDSKSASENLERLIISGNINREQQIRILTTIENKTRDTQRVVDDLSRYHQQEISGVKEAVDGVSAQIFDLFSVKGYIQGWIRQIVQSCKDIITMIEDNTQILVSMHNMLTKLSVLLNRSNINMPILEFENPFGQTLALPYQLCNTWDGLNRLLLCMFFDKPSLKMVEAGRFLLTDANTNNIIKPSLWSASISPGDKIFMSMVLERTDNERNLCPRCNRRLPKLSSTGAICERCQLWSSTAEDNIILSIPQFSKKWGIPSPPPEDIMVVRNFSWNDNFATASARAQACKRLMLSLCGKRIRKMRDNGNADIPPTSSTRKENAVDLLTNLTDNEIEKTFRRVHVVPFQDDPLEAVAKTGQRCRDLKASFSLGWPTLHQSLSSAAFHETFSDILSDLERIYDLGISPWVELAARRGGLFKREKFEDYLSETATILVTAPIDDAVTYQKALRLALWLSPLEYYRELVRQQVIGEKGRKPIRNDIWERIFSLGLNDQAAETRGYSILHLHV